MDNQEPMTAQLNPDGTGTAYTGQVPPTEPIVTPMPQSTGPQQVANPVAQETTPDMTAGAQETTPTQSVITPVAAVTGPTTVVVNPAPGPVGKHWTHSSTIAINAVFILTFLIQVMAVAQNPGFLRDPQQVAIVASIQALLVAIVNILNRMRTTQPLTR